MSEVQPRPFAPRGRGSGRGGRGGYSSRSGRGGSRPANGEKSEPVPLSTYEDEGEIGQLKKQYASKLSTIKEMFPDWTAEDIVFALQETNGNLEDTIERISEGNISQWGEVKKKTKDRARSKVKDSHTSMPEAGIATSRGGRGRGGSDGPRGGRGRPTERGRGAGRSFRGASAVNGNRNHDKGATEAGHEASTTTGTNESPLWDTPSDPVGSIVDQSNPGGASPPDASWEVVTPIDHVPPPIVEESKPSLKPDGARSWATLFAKPVPVPAPARAKASPAPPGPEPVAEPLIAPELEQPVFEEPGLPPPVPVEELALEEPLTPRSNGLPPSEQATNITPSKDELTETNLEQILDISNPPATATAASTVATTHDPRSGAGSTTPLLASQQHHAGLRPGLGGYATSAYKATGGSGRSASFQRRVMEQQEAVVMPGNHAVDRAAVQFGSMGLNSTSEDLDVDDEREEAETRTQPPQHSPVAPRAALPPAPQQPIADPLPTPRQAPGLPPAGPQSGSQQATQPTQPDQALPTPPTQGSYPYHQFNNRYGQPTNQQDITGPAQKAYEPFGQQIQQPTSQQHQYDGFPSQPQVPVQQPQSAQNALGTYSSAAADYSSYYTSESQRNAYQNYYGSYGQPSQQVQPEAGATQQRIGSALGSSGIEQPSQYATAQSQQPPLPRYSSATENQNSGHSTPNPALGQQSHLQAQLSHQMPQQQPQNQTAGQHATYPYGHPYYNNNPYYNYMNQVSHHSYGRDRPMFDDVRRYDDQYLTHNHQFGYGGSQGGYGGGPYAGAGAKQGMYGQPHQGYGMSPQTTYDQHSASPANVGGYGQQSHSVPARDGTSTGLGGYGRTGSTQPSEGQQQQAGSSGGFGGVPDVFGRTQAAYLGQTQNQGVGQQSGNDEPARSYGDSSKVPGGPSPVGQIAGRPASATNTLQSQSSLPSSQGPSQHAYNAYQSPLNPQIQGQQASQYGSGLGGLGGHHQTGAQSQQGSGYAGGYGGAFGGNYYGNNSRGGWSGNYGH